MARVSWDHRVSIRAVRSSYNLRLRDVLTISGQVSFSANRRNLGGGTNGSYSFVGTVPDRQSSVAHLAWVRLVGVS